MLILFLSLLLTLNTFAQLQSVGTMSTPPTVAVTVGTTDVCTRFQLIPGCQCTSGLMKPTIICNCAEIFASEKQVFKIFLGYDNHNQCAINYFPGCQPKVLNPEEGDLCQKYGRHKVKLPTTDRQDLNCEQIFNPCPDGYRMRCQEAGGLLDIHCIGEDQLTLSLKVQN